MTLPSPGEDMEWPWECTCGLGWVVERKLGVADSGRHNDRPGSSALTHAEKSVIRTGNVKTTNKGEQ